MDTFKVLGQANPSVGVLTDLYTVPASTQTTISSLYICNGGAGQAGFRISIAIGGAADALSQYLYYNLPLYQYDTFVATVGLTLSAGDVVRVYTDLAGVSFNIFGVEVA